MGKLTQAQFEIQAVFEEKLIFSGFVVVPVHVLLDVTCRKLSSPVAQCVARRAPMQQCVRWLVRAPSSS